MLNACEKGTYTNSVDPDETPRKRGVSSGSALFAKISTHLVMVNYKKNVNDQALWWQIPTSSQILSKIKIGSTHTFCTHNIAARIHQNFGYNLHIFLVQNVYANAFFFRMRSYAPLTQALENSTRPLVFTSASGCGASENFDICSENYFFPMYANIIVMQGKCLF